MPKAFKGWVDQRGWCVSQRRAGLARQLVDAAEDGKLEWVGCMPAVSLLRNYDG